MILGEDIGNVAVKSSKEVIFASKCAKVGNLLSSISITTDTGTFYIGDGPFDTEYRKVKKEFTKAFLLYSISQSTSDTNNKIVVGLPLSQYKQDKEEYRNLLMSSRINDLKINGSFRRIIIDDILVYPEGVGAIAGTDYEGIIIDIGGRTTDVCLVSDNNGVKKVNNPYSMPKGTLNLYSDFIKIVNSRFGLELNSSDVDKILKLGLKIDGQDVNCDFAIDVFRQYVDELVGDLRIEYSLKTNDVLLVGGGTQLLYKAIKNRIPAATIISDPVFANAKGFKKVGDMTWL